jgi:PAS domain S-box-containing protein
MSAIVTELSDERRRLIDALPGLVWTANSDGICDYFNQPWLNYAGLPLDEVIVKGWQIVVHPDDLPLIEAAWNTCLATGAPGEADARLRRFDGEYRRFSNRASPLINEAGRLVGWCGINTDIENRTRAEEALTRARAELNHVARATALSALTASIAHEVNQPLTAIIANASACLRMLAADPPNIEGARATAQRTIRDGDRAAEVIHRLRALFARKEPRMEPVDPNDAAREVLMLSSAELQRRRVIVRSDFAEDLPAVHGDRVQLQQVILNLVLNAADAMSAVDDRPRDLLVATARDDDGCVRLSVTDAGAGFDSADVDRLFDPFFTTKAEGMGIGLSISRSIVESHEGRLTAAANDGPGATFSFSIPARPELPAG